MGSNPLARVPCIVAPFSVYWTRFGLPARHGFTLSKMSRLGDVFYFLRQIFFPNWVEREEDGQPNGLQKVLAAVLRFFASRHGTGTLFSIILHAFLLVMLSLMIGPQLVSFTGIDTLSGFLVPGIEQAVNIAPAQESKGDNGQQNVVPDSDPSATSGNETSNEPPSPPSVDSVPETQSLDTNSWKVNAPGGFANNGGFGHRNTAGRQGAMNGGGSTQGSEKAVEMALEWLALHRNKQDGGWSLHFADSCGQCSHSGTRNRRTAATALALLSFLGAGYTHQEQSPYREVVDKGLSFLIEEPNGGYNGAAIQQDLLRMYSDGLAAMALCEAYAMARGQNPRLKLGWAAQKSLLFIENAQRESGGWNYRSDQKTWSRQPDLPRLGDTSIFAWQLMALKSGNIGGLDVSQSVLYAAQDFLDSVALEGGRRYQYTSTGDNWDAILSEDSPKTCTAIGLLMRMYLGWKPGDPALDEGMAQLARWGYILQEDKVNLYYAYYATLALHHYGGEHWEAWNSGLRDFLIHTQSREGCEAGSWHFSDPHGDVGGRLLNTTLAVMILETPYRFMPLYRKIR